MLLRWKSSLWLHFYLIGERTGAFVGTKSYLNAVPETNYSYNCIYKSEFYSPLGGAVAVVKFTRAFPPRRLST